MITRLCVVGATGRFGRSIIAQAPSDIEITGAVCSDSNPSIGRSLGELGIGNSTTVLNGASHIGDAAANSDVVAFVSKPAADIINIPKVASMQRRILLGTTGFTEAQASALRTPLKTVPSIIASNFSIGANLLFQITELLAPFNHLYDYSVVEQHHKMKADAPSGTAKQIIELLNRRGAFPKIVTDRTAQPKRMEGEVEVVSLRGGGTPGVHQLTLFGEHEMISVEHFTFSRVAAATGLLAACRWLASKEKPGIYSMAEVLQSTYGGN